MLGKKGGDNVWEEDLRELLLTPHARRQKRCELKSIANREQGGEGMAAHGYVELCPPGSPG